MIITQNRYVVKAEYEEARKVFDANAKSEVTLASNTSS